MTLEFTDFFIHVLKMDRGLKNRSARYHSAEVLEACLSV